MLELFIKKIFKATATPHYPPTTPGQYHYPNTPYTPSGQTPFMTPYMHTPRYGAHTPSQPVSFQGPSHHPSPASSHG